MTYEIKTNNGYTSAPVEYTFKVTINELNEIEGTLTVEDSSVFCQDNGCLRVTFTTDDTHKLSGNYVLSRSSEKTNFTVWEDIKYFLFTAQKEFTYTDYSVENGVGYKYALQNENKYGMRTKRLVEETNVPRLTHFEYTYLLNNDTQLKLQFDNNVSSFKHHILDSKQDTLGSKYASVSRNGYAHYAEFPITGLITLRMDDDNTFLHLLPEDYEYERKRNHCDPSGNEPAPVETNDKKFISTAVTKENVLKEYDFRQLALEWLDDGKLFLYRSATEGNIIVRLTDISLTPKQTLGRMIWSFSASAVEVAENTFENLYNYGIISIGEYQEFSEDEQYIFLGQVGGMYYGDPDYPWGRMIRGEYRIESQGLVPEAGSADNLVDLIEADNSFPTNEEGKYRYKFDNVYSIWVEQFPVLRYETELTELHAKLAEAQSSYDTEKIEFLTKQIAALEEFVHVLTTEQTYPLITLVINGQEITMGPNKVYTLNKLENITDIHLKYSIPVLLNYTCKVHIVENEEKTQQAIEDGEPWGQVNGVFTETVDVLSAYNYRYEESQFHIGEYTIIDEDNGNAVFYHLYETKNIMDLIKDESKRQIEASYGVKFTKQDAQGKWSTEDGLLLYSFQDVKYIEIEADPGTALLIGKNDAEDAIEVQIGPTGKYIINNNIPTTSAEARAFIKYLAFKEPSFAIINYICITQQERMSGGGTNE